MSSRINKKPSYNNEDIQSSINQDMSGVGAFISGLDKIDTDLTTKVYGVDKKLSFDENMDLNNRGDPLDSDQKRTTKKPPTSNLAYGSKKPKKEGTTADEKDRIINLSKENRLLKEKENLLEKEILKLNTKLRRIDNLARSVSHMQANDPTNQHGNVDMIALQTELQDQLTTLQDENARKRKKNHQLKEIEKDLKFKAKNSHLPNISHNSKYDHVKGKLGYTRMSKGNQSYLNLMDELKQTLVQNQRQLLVLQKEKEKLGAKQSGIYSIDQLKNQIESMQKEIRDIDFEMDKIQTENTRNETMFRESKNYMNELQTQKNEVTHQTMHLKQKNYELKLRAGQVKDLQLESKTLDEDIKGTERAIRNLTTEPFIKKQQGESTGNRIADLEAKLAAKTRVLQQRQDEERVVDKRAEELRTEYENIQGEKLFLENENDKLTAQYKEIADKNHVDIWNSLFQVDPAQYQQTMTDLAKNTAVNPTWKNIDFLERDGRNIDMHDPLQVDMELKRLKHENQEFAAELEKAQNLLSLQKDIERENTRYYENEKKRLQLILKNNQSKKEDLAKRADDKFKQIEDLRKMAGLDKSLQPDKSLGIGADAASTQDTNDGFSVMSNEPDLPTDENMLDLKIINAELFKDRFTSIVDREAGISNSNTFITLATVEYFNHETQCSKPAHGYTPLYNSQFSFPNKVDEFYVNKLMTQPLHIDIYIVRNNNPIHLGSCKLYVRELVDQESALQDYSLKPPVLEKTIQILPAGLLARSQLSEKAKEEPVGQITVKMRMRKQISQAMRFYREKNEIENLTKQKQVMQNESGALKSRRRMITIEIVRARNIKPKFGDMTSIQPFFYYQFYDKTDKYSYTCSGVNPEFNDVENYEILFDAKAIDYFERQKLKIFLMDENSPITGQEKGGQAFGDDDENADLIGVADVDMINLIQNGVVQDSFPIRDLERKMVGELEVRIQSRDIESHADKTQALTEVSYSEQWQEDIIIRIAKKLAKFNCEVNLMFGIFSRGQRSVTKEDFKYCVLQRLNLRKSLADREIDIFLNEHPQLVGQDSITQDQFCTLFAKAITDARNDTLNKEAYEMSLIHRYNEVSSTMRDQQQADIASGKKIKPENIIEKNTNLNLQEKDAFIILLSCLKNGQIDQIQSTLKNSAKNDNIDISRFRQVLILEGQISDFDSGKIAQMLDYDGQISINRFNDFVEKLIPYGQTESAAYQKFLRLLQTEGESICQRLESQDLNKDGELNEDGFKAAMLHKDLNLSSEEIQEVFNLTKRNQLLAYVEFLKNIDPQLLQFLSTTLKRQATSRSHILDQSAAGLTIKDDLTETHMTIQEQQQIEAPKLKSAKQKVEMFITAQNTLLSVIFQVIDMDLNNALTLHEFKQRIVTIGIQLDPDEVEVLFKSLDMNGNGQISFKEFIQQFSHINVTQLIKRMKKMITESKVPPVMIFERFSNDTYKTQISRSDFKELVFSFIDKPHDFEINSLFAHFDSNKKGFITKADFENAFGKDFNEQEFNSSIEDLIKPLSTLFKHKNQQVLDYFHKNFESRNLTKLSPQAIYEAICKNIPNFEDLQNHREVADQEVNTIKEYIKNKYNTNEMRYMDFRKLLSEQLYKNKCSQPEAVKQLASVKSKIDNRGTQSRSHFLPFKDVIDVRSFKHKIHQLNALNQYAIDNMTKYLDKKNEGFIQLELFENELKMARAKTGQGSSIRR